MRRAVATRCIAVMLMAACINGVPVPAHTSVPVPAPTSVPVPAPTSANNRFVYEPEVQRNQVSKDAVMQLTAVLQGPWDIVNTLRFALKYPAGILTASGILSTMWTQAHPGHGRTWSKISLCFNENNYFEFIRTGDGRITVKEVNRTRYLYYDLYYDTSTEEWVMPTVPTRLNSSSSFSCTAALPYTQDYDETKPVWSALYDATDLTDQDNGFQALSVVGALARKGTLMGFVEVAIDVALIDQVLLSAAQRWSLKTGVLFLVSTASTLTATSSTSALHRMLVTESQEKYETSGRFGDSSSDRDLLVTITPNRTKYWMQGSALSVHPGLNLSVVVVQQAACPPLSNPTERGFCECKDASTRYRKEPTSSVPCAWCAPGRFMNPKKGTCDLCMRSAECKGKDYAPIPLAGFWTKYPPVLPVKSDDVLDCTKYGINGCSGSAFMSNETLECWRSGFDCTNITTQHLEKQMCEDGSLGIMCSRCEKSYMFSSSAKKCVECQGGTDIILNAQSIFFGVLLLVLMLMMLNVASCCNNWISWVTGVDGHLFLKEHRIYFNKLWIVVAPLYNIAVPKLVWSTYQIVCSVPVTLHVLFPSPFDKLLSFVWVSQLEFSEMTGVACFFPQYRDFIWKTYISALAPIVVVAINWTVCQIRVSLFTPVDNRLVVFSQHMHFFMIFIYCVVPPMTRMLAAGLVCENRTIRDENFLVASPGIDCESDLYKRFRVFVWCMFVLYVSVPLFCLALLFAKHEHIVMNDEVSLELRHVLRYDPSLRPYRFLIKHYKRRAWAYDIYDMYRRIFLVCIIPTLIPAPVSSKATIGCILSLLAIMISTNLKPYELEVVNSLSEMCQYFTFFTYFLAVILVADFEQGLKTKGNQWSLMGATITAALAILSLFSLWPWLQAIIRFRRIQQDLEARLAQLPRVGAHKYELKRPLTLLKLVESKSVSKLSFLQLHYFEHMQEAVEREFATALHASDPMVKAALKKYDAGARASRLVKVVIQPEKPKDDKGRLGELKGCVGWAKPFDASEEKWLVCIGDGSLSNAIKIRTRHLLEERLDETGAQSLQPLLTSAAYGESGVQMLNDFGQEADHLREELAEVVRDLLEANDMIVKCDQVIEQSQSVLTPLYDAAWSLIEHTERKGIDEYQIECAGLKMMSAQSCTTQVNVRGDLKNLLHTAARAKPHVDKAMHTISAKAACRIAAKKPKTAIRVLEQVEMLNTDSFDKVTDILQYLFVANNMAHVAAVAASFHKHGDLSIVEVKDEILSPAYSGFRSLKLYFYHKLDTSKHICEAEISHSRIQSLRSGMSSDTEDENARRPSHHSFSDSFTIVKGSRAREKSLSGSSSRFSFARKDRKRKASQVLVHSETVGGEDSMRSADSAASEAVGDAKHPGRDDSDGSGQMRDRSSNTSAMSKVVQNHQKQKSKRTLVSRASLAVGFSVDKKQDKAATSLETFHKDFRTALEMLQRVGFPYGEDRVALIQNKLAQDPANEHTILARMVHLGFSREILMKAGVASDDLDVFFTMNTEQSIMADVSGRRSSGSHRRKITPTIAKKPSRLLSMHDDGMGTDSDDPPSDERSRKTSVGFMDTLKGVRKKSMGLLLGQLAPRDDSGQGAKVSPGCGAAHEVEEVSSEHTTRLRHEDVEDVGDGSSGEDTDEDEDQNGKGKSARLSELTPASATLAPLTVPRHPLTGAAPAGGGHLDVERPRKSSLKKPGPRRPSIEPRGRRPSEPKVQFASSPVQETAELDCGDSQAATAAKSRGSTDSFATSEDTGELAAVAAPQASAEPTDIAVAERKARRKRVIEEAKAKRNARGDGMFASEPAQIIGFADTEYDRNPEMSVQEAHALANAVKRPVDTETDAR